eukprot:TRINITY_DN551_c0_g1_i6.p3 TRINITY_DN551_c0_g1~~TRINITY_DN551_c0_g1_i6.p3  ORF type:complete len:578 (-),score=68.33 TRINITY_DN551_c0_g1_i6:211-1944(-)
MQSTFNSQFFAGCKSQLKILNRLNKHKFRMVSSNGVVAQVGTQELQLEETDQQLKQLADLKFEHTFVSELPSDPERKNFVRQVSGALYSWVDPTPTSTEPYLVAYSPEACQLLDLDPEECKTPEFVNVFSGQAPLPQGQPYAQCYGGHQFGSWAGQLGDGRAITLGESINSKGDRWELQLKGAGKTPYSRFADGRAVMRSSIREFVASEALFHLGIPTTRALCCVGTGAEVMRDMFYNGDVKMEPGAVVCRVSPSFVRFGTFQLPATRESDQALIKQLADYVIKYHFSHLQQDDKKYSKFFAEVVESTAKLIAKWQCVGFVHGVLNTDNMSILGLTIDYGPYGFVDRFDPLFTPNLTDFQGRRYCFRNQPEIGQTNLVLFGRALVEGKLMEASEVSEALVKYTDVLEEDYKNGVARKLGLKEYDGDLVKTLMQNMYEDDADFTNTFRSLNSISSSVNGNGDPLPAELRAAIGGQLKEDRELAWISWVNQYREKLSEEGTDEQQRIAIQNAANPVYIPRQHLLQLSIEAAEKGDFSELEQFMNVLKNPFAEQEGADKYRQPPTPDMIKPGITCLSCSS